MSSDIKETCVTKEMIVKKKRFFKLIFVTFCSTKMNIILLSSITMYLHSDSTLVNTLEIYNRYNCYVSIKN